MLVILEALQPMGLGSDIQNSGLGGSECHGDLPKRPQIDPYQAWRGLRIWVLGSAPLVLLLRVPRDRHGGL